MTLILTCLTTDFVLQASDRRLTFADGPSRGKIKDDGRTKAVVLANAAAFAYTGLAEVGPEARTDYWLLDVLTAAPTIVEVYQEVYQNFLAGATSEFRRIATRLPKLDRRHAFVGGGWSRASADANAPMVPYVATVANALDLAGDWLRGPTDEFQFRRRFLNLGARFYVHAAGARIEKDDHARLDVCLRKVLKRDGEPTAIAQCLVRAIRATSERHPTVGQSALVVSLPKTMAERGGTSLRISENGRIESDAATSVYFPANSMHPENYAAHFMSGAGVSYRDFSAPR